MSILAVSYTHLTSGFQGNLCSFDIRERDAHSADDHRWRRRGRAFMVIAGNRESQQRSQAAGKIEIRIAVIDPGTNAHARAVGERDVGTDDHAIVIDSSGDSDRLRLGRGSGFVLRPHETAQQKPCASSDVNFHASNCSATIFVARDLRNHKRWCSRGARS